VPETLTAEFADLVQFGVVREDWFKLYNAAFVQMDQPTGSLVGQQPPTNPAPAKPLAAYVGQYENSFWGPARVTQQGDGLQVAIGPKLVFPLEHWDGNVFSVSFVTENSPPGSISKATFDGNKLVLEYYDVNGTGTFTR
jgi:hypothetical protein